jgi:hypothetical protein
MMPMMTPCEFCGRPSTLLCDGKLPNGTTCNKRICRGCAQMTARVLMATKHGRRCDTRDLCPACVKAAAEAKL